jgi:magnesium-transporting ATPase (P-type)
MPTHVWYNLKRTRVLEILKTRTNGLSDREVVLRRKQYGMNELARGRQVFWLSVLGNQFRGALVYILITAALISALLRD